MRTNTDERIVVIGSGPSGAMAALQLVERGAPVTVLESGRHMPDGFLVRAMGRNVFRRRRDASDDGHGDSSQISDANWVQSLVPGGLSNYWVGASPRFSPEDFTDGERLHERYRWPVTYRDLRSYYERAERVLRIVGDPRDVPGLPGPTVVQRRQLSGGWRAVANRAEQLGQGLTPMPLADGPNWNVTRTGVGFNSYWHVLRPLQRRPNLDVRLGAHVLKLEWDGNRKRVGSVIYRDRFSGTDEAIATSAVVVAAGPLASTALMFNSACSDFPEGLGDVEGLLGRYFHEHPRQWFPLELRSGTLPALPHAAYLTRTPIGQAAPLLGAGCTIGFASSRDKVLSVLRPRANRFGVLVFGTMVPTERNYLRPQPINKDEFGQPVLDVHIEYSSDELQNLETARLRLAEVLDSAGYGCSVPKHVPVPPAGGSVHYGGTMRMHASSKYGMLDRWSRLHAVSNVVVADASAFTTGVEKNPTLTAMALAARAADHLVDDLKAA